MDLCLSYKSSPLSYYIYILFKRFSDLCTVIPSVYPSFVRFLVMKFNEPLVRPPISYYLGINLLITSITKFVLGDVLFVSMP